MSASGKSVTRKGSWKGGQVPAGGRFLLVNADGAFASGGDLQYSGGLSAAGGSVDVQVDNGNGSDLLANGFNLLGLAIDDGLCLRWQILGLCTLVGFDGRILAM